MPTLSLFDQLLRSAAAQAEPQRLLFVFTTAELPADATPAQRQRFAEGAGGTLTPLMCVDKGLDELSSFEQLLQESRLAGPPWQVLFAAGLPGRNGQPPGPQQVEQALQTMVERIKGGMVSGFLALDASGEAVHFQ